jgi:hypothetical protein
MRHYPPDSPRAAARVLALALLADGAIDPCELRTLHRHRMLARLGLDEDDFDAVIHALCEDLLVCAQRASAGHLEIGREALREVLGDIRSPYLQRKLLRAVLQIVGADGETSGGEAALVSLASERWQLEATGMLPLPASPGRRWPPQAHPIRHTN